MSLARFIPALAALVALAGTAHADTPAFLDGPALTTLCHQIQLDAACPACTCEPITSTSPIAQSAGSPVEYGVILLVKGRGPRGDLESLEVAVGTEAALVHVGRVAERALSDDDASAGVLAVASAKQVYAGEVGDRDGDAVGIVHIFEINESLIIPVTHPELGGPELPKVEWRDTTRLVTCFADNTQPACWSLVTKQSSHVDEVGQEPGDHPKKGPESGLTRSWKLRKPFMIEIGKTKITGTLDQPPGDPYVSGKHVWRAYIAENGVLKVTP